MPRFRNPIISTANIPDGAITTAKLANLAVTTPKIAALAVTTAKIDLLAVGAAQIADLAVTSAKIAALAVTDAKIANATITAAKIATLNADAIVAGTITGRRYRTASSGERLEIRGDTSEAFLRLFDSGGTQRATMGIISTGPTEVGIDAAGADLVLTASGAGTQIEIGANLGVTLTGGLSIFGGNLSMPGNGQILMDTGSVGAPGLAFPFPDDDTGIFRSTDGVDTVMVFAAGGLSQFFTGRGSQAYLRISTDGSAGNPALRINDTDTGLYRTAAGSLAASAGGGAGWAIDTSRNMYIDRVLPDIGNHETLRANRDTTAGLTQIGYFSSSRAAKREIVPLSRSPLWRREWFDLLRPVKYRRRSTQGRELGFLLEDLAGIGPRGEGRFLTTGGERLGGSPDEFALLAVTIDAVQDLRRRVALLEAV